jgi:hypothetical protein
MNKFKANVWVAGKCLNDLDGILIWCDGRIERQMAGKLVDSYPKGIISLSTGVPDANGRILYDGDIVTYNGVEGKIAFFSGMYLIEYYDQTDSGPIGFLQTKDLFFVKSSYSKLK